MTLGKGKDERQINLEEAEASAGIEQGMSVTGDRSQKATDEDAP
jgi:hypothetical protein